MLKCKGVKREVKLMRRAVTVVAFHADADTFKDGIER